MVRPVPMVESTEIAKVSDSPEFKINERGRWYQRILPDVEIFGLESGGGYIIE